MNKVEFDTESSTFVLTRDGIETPFSYYPNSRNVWNDLKDESFTVILLTNPFLHKEIDYFEIDFNDSKERGGFLFPVSLLESTEPEGKPLLSYLFVAYRKLLLMINDDTNITGVLSERYPDAYILVIHNETVPDFNLSDYLISLASYGFYEYKGKINAKFPDLEYFKEQNKKLILNKSDNNLSNKYVFDLLKNRLFNASDFITRFVLVYQVVELYISNIHNYLLDEKINNYKSGALNKNDFGEELKNISRESYQIEILLQDYIEEKVCIDFRNTAIGLFNDVAYNYKNEKIQTLFYALRNQIFHNYNVFIEHETTLSEVIFYFERVVMMLLAKKSIK